MKLSTVAFALCLAGAGSGCERELPKLRTAGERVSHPLRCDPSVPEHCLLPWPTSRAARADPTSPTGVRLAVDTSAENPFDDPAMANRQSGFSRLSTVMVWVPEFLESLPAGSLRTFVAEPGASQGLEVPLNFRLVYDQPLGEDPRPESGTLIAGAPFRALREGAEHLSVLLAPADGSFGSAGPDRWTEVALGLVPPENAEEEHYFAYHAPAREILSAKGIDISSVLKLWDFVTRDAAEPITFLRQLRERTLAALDSVEIVITATSTVSAANALLAVEGELRGVPAFFGAGEAFAVDREGLPRQVGTTDVPFRILIPTGSGDYPIVMWGHGMGKDFDDRTLDASLSSLGLAKVGFRFDGWHGSSGVVSSFVKYVDAYKGTSLSIARLAQSLAHGAALRALLETRLGDILAGADLGGTINPAAGRRPTTNLVLWAGASLGGALGYVYSLLDPKIFYGALNVPGAAWTHFISDSSYFDAVAFLGLEQYETFIGTFRAMRMTQGQWDMIDGAAWDQVQREEDPIFLLQESVGDQIVANIGTETLARTINAVLVGEVIQAVPELEESNAARVRGQSALTQYRVAGDDLFDQHGFAGKSWLPGQAARQQVTDFLQSAIDGDVEISIPVQCDSGSCDFLGQERN